jgi:MarR family transcriptional regulator for hemolysin
MAYPDQREALFQILSLMKTNLVQACRTPLAENETNHG